MKTVSTKHKRKLQLVYVLESASGLTKIGITNNLKRRISQIEAASGHEIINHWGSEPTPKAGEFEDFAHEHFKRYRKKGEWFDVDYESTKKQVQLVCTGRKLTIIYVNYGNHYLDSQGRYFPTAVLALAEPVLSAIPKAAPHRPKPSAIPTQPQTANPTQPQGNPTYTPKKRFDVNAGYVIAALMLIVPAVLLAVPNKTINLIGGGLYGLLFVGVIWSGVK